MPEISKLLHQMSGLKDDAHLHSAVKRRMQQCGLDLRGYTEKLVLSLEEQHILLEMLVVPETWFFRDSGAFILASEFAVVALASLKRPLRILSVPCATGEEPYTIAMAMLDAGLSAANVSIDGIDISSKVISRAKVGRYSKNSFREKNLSFRERYFDPIEDDFALRSEIKKMVKLAQGNLFQMDASSTNDSMSAPPVVQGLFDLIFCRNLLIYFDANTQCQAIAKLDSLLTEGGMLFVGCAEAPVFQANGFMVVRSARAPHTLALQRKHKQKNATPNNLIGASATLPTFSSATLPTFPRRKVMMNAAQANAVLPTQKSLKSNVVPKNLAQRNATSAPIDRLATLFGEASLLADQGQASQAQRKFSDYLQQAPHGASAAEASFMLGLLNENGDLCAAEKYLRQAIYLDPDHYQALCHLALLLEKNGDQPGCARLRQRAARVFGRKTVMENHS